MTNIIFSAGWGLTATPEMLTHETNLIEPQTLLNKNLKRVKKKKESLKRNKNIHCFQVLSQGNKSLWIQKEWNSDKCFEECLFQDRNIMPGVVGGPKNKVIWFFFIIPELSWFSHNYSVFTKHIVAWNIMRKHISKSFIKML